MKITGSVSADQIPAGQQLRSRGIWQELVERALNDYRNGKATVVEIDNWDEYQRLRTGTQVYWRKAGMRLNTTIVPRADGGDAMTVYLELEERTDLQPTNLGRPRQRKAAR